MIKNGSGGANTLTGAIFEKQIQINQQGINLTKYNLYKYLKENGIDYTTIISKKLLPDEAYFNPNTKEFSIYEKKFQSVAGSVDGKSLKLVALKSINFVKLELLSVLLKQLILIFLMTGLKNPSIKIC